MDFKDFKVLIKEALSKKAKKALTTYEKTQRQSRPRVSKDILRPDQ